MELHGERIFIRVAHALHRLVVPVEVADDRARRKLIGIDHEAVVLRRDGAGAARQILDRVVRAVVAVFHLHRAPAHRQRHQLMAQANAEHRLFAHQLADGLYGLRVILRVSGAVGQHHAVAAGIEDGLRVRIRREHAQRAAAAQQRAQNAALEAEVQHGDGIRTVALHVVSLLAGALRDLIVHLVRPDQREIRLGRLALDDAPAQRAVFANMPGQRAGIHAAKAGHALLVQILVERLLHLPVARRIAQFGYDKAAHPHARALAVDIVDAHVAHERIGHADDLTAIRGVGQRFLIAGHAGREDDLSRYRSLVPEQRSLVAGAVLQNQCCHRRTLLYHEYKLNLSRIQSHIIRNRIRFVNRPDVQKESRPKRRPSQKE